MKTLTASTPPSSTVISTHRADGPTHVEGEGEGEGLFALIRRLCVQPATSRTMGAAGLLLLLLAGLFWPTLTNFVFIWSTNDNYSHGFLVPFLSLYFAHEATRKARHPLAVRSGVGFGVALLALAILGRWLTTLVPLMILGDLSFLLGLTGLLALLAGRDAVRRYGFALFFLVFMVPLPVALYTLIANPLQLAVSQAAGGLLNFAGIPVLCEGNMMTLPGGVKMFVAEACSGMRQLTGFLALATAVAFFTKRPWWYRSIVIVSAVPIAMTANVVRVVVTGFIMYYWDPHYAQGAYHSVEGLLLMGLGLALLTAEIWLLGQIFVFDDTPTPAPSSPSAIGGVPA